MWKTPDLASKFTDAVLDVMKHSFVEIRGERVEGESVSALYNELVRWGSWKGFGGLNGFEGALEEVGFRIVSGHGLKAYPRNNGEVDYRRGRSIRAVVL